MRHRPWPIVLLAFLHLFGPIGNIFFSAYLDHLHPWTYMMTLWKVESWWGLVDFYILLPLGGWAIYQCRKWSYPVFLFVAADTMWVNYQSWRAYPALFPMWLLVLTLLLDVLFVGYFLIPQVRITYMDPRMRWWESKPRYIVKFQTTLKMDNASFQGEITDISEGGVFFKTSHEIHSEGISENAAHPIYLKFQFLDFTYAIEGHVVYGRENPERGYGVQFTAKQNALRDVKRLIRTLNKMGIHHRNYFNWREDFKNWSLTLLKTGKGLIPEIPVRKKAQV